MKEKFLELVFNYKTVFNFKNVYNTQHIKTKTCEIYITRIPSDFYTWYFNIIGYGTTTEWEIFFNNVLNLPDKEIEEVMIQMQEHLIDKV